MPIKIPNDLPAFEKLEAEGVQLIGEDEALRQDIRPMQVALLNLMPDKPKTEMQLARLLGAGLGTRVAAVQTGGFDTHDEQPDDHARLLQDLGDSLLAWQEDLAARGLARRVLTLVWSEFGRRPADNESKGTDHGAGGLVLVVGERANGGIRSEFPGLSRLDEDDNLLVSTDFRTVYATLLESWLGIEAGRVLPRPGPGRLELVRPA